MVVDWFLILARGMSSWVLGLMPHVDVSQVVVTAQDLIGPFSAGIAETSAWIPWQQLAIMGPLVMGMYVVSLFARALRMLLGHIPLIGGNG